MFPVFCKSSEVGLIGKLDVQKGRVFGLNNQSSDRHTNITTTHNILSRSPLSHSYVQERINSIAELVLLMVN